MLDVDFDELRQAILVQVEHQVRDEVEAIANNDESDLVLKLDLLEEDLDFLRIVEVAFTTDTLDFPDLASASRRLNVFKVNLRILA